MRLVCPHCGASCDWFRTQMKKEIPDLIRREWLLDPVEAANIVRYDAIAMSREYAGHADTKPEFRAQIVKDMIGDLSFVEIGPGFGELLWSTSGERWVVDQSSQMLEWLRGIPDVKLVRALADRLPFKHAEAIVADSVFQTVPCRERFLCGAWQALSPGGLFVFSVAYRWNYPRRPQQGFNVLDKDGRLLLRRYLEELGFDTELWGYLSLSAEDWVSDIDGGSLLYIAARKT